MAGEPPQKLVLLGGGVPLVIATVTVLLWLMGVFPDHNSKSLAMIVIAGGALAGLMIFGFALLRKFDDYVSRMVYHELQENSVTETTTRVLEFAREALERVISELLDDPSDLRQDHELDGGPTPQTAITYYRQLAVDLGLDFDALVEKGHPNKIDRLRAIEQQGD